MEILVLFNKFACGRSTIIILNKLMNKIKDYLYSFIKKRVDLTDKQIDELVVGDYFDSLDLVDLIVDIEITYDIEVDEKMVDKLQDMRLSELIEYVKSKLDLK